MRHSKTLLIAVIAMAVSSGTAVFVQRSGGWASLVARFSSFDWPVVESYELELDVRQPGRFGARAVVELSGIESTSVSLLLNEHLEVLEAVVEGEPVAVRYGRLPRSPYRGEARVVRLRLPSVPADGRATLALRYAGPAEGGREGPDWRGILFVDEDETRMCEQTVFYPQVPQSLEGPAVARAPFSLSVVTPKEWEVFVPASGGLVSSGNGERRFAFRAERARNPALLGGVRRRVEARVGDLEVVTLLSAEHAELANAFVAETARVIESYTERFGAIESGVLGIIEIHCRDSSYNWTADGVMAFDRGALGAGVPLPSLAHEVAHLWWGGAVEPTGRGERFLTEGLAEFSSWTWLLEHGEVEEATRAVGRARSALAGLREKGDDLALADVRFGVRGYTTLAYDKGALVLSALRGQLAEGALDDALRELVALGADREVTLVDFERLVAEASEGARVPWLHAAGDLQLALEEVNAGANALTAVIVAEPTLEDSGMDVAGTPVALQVGGRGWSERRTCTLEGARTELRLEPDARGAPAYLRLDPSGAFTTPIVGGCVVFDGARLVSTIPTRGAPVEFGGTRIELSFDRPLSPPNLDELRRAQLAPLPEGERRPKLLAVELGEDARTLVVTTAPWPPERRYALALTSIVDADGLPVAPESFELEVAPSSDRTSPRIVATTPENGARVRPQNGRIEVALTFDEPMRAGYAITGTGVREIEARGYTKPQFEGFGRLDDDGRTIRWTFTEYEVGVEYALPIRERTFHDLSGNPVEPLDLVFTVVGED